MTKLSFIPCLILAAVAAVLPVNHAHAATYELEAHSLFTDGDQFSISGVFSTPAAVTHQDCCGAGVTSFIGTIDGQVASLVPLGTASGFDYDNLFFGPPEPSYVYDDSFDNRGLLLVAGGVFFNLYEGIALSSAGLDVFATGDIRLLSTSAVPEAGTRILILLAGCMFCAWRLLRK